MTLDEAVSYAETTPVAELCSRAGALRLAAHGDDFDTCSIMNARSGRCSENCKWCAQSAHWAGDCEVYPLVSAEEALAQARHNFGKGVRRFSLVTSGRAVAGAELAAAAAIYAAIRTELPGLALCASMGLLSRADLQVLFDAGVRRYHCNLETAPSFFSELCTTHTALQKMETIAAAREVGMEVCSGGIIGMGETRRQRLELALVLHDLGVQSIPLNVLSPIAGTPLAGLSALPDDEVLIAMAMFRILNPTAHIRLAGGRARIKHLERQLLHSGVSASIVGDMLTTAGSDIASDFETFTSEGFKIS